MGIEVEKTKRKGLYLGGADNSQFDLHKEEDFMEVTNWSNGEGWTISINNSLGARTFELSYSELEGIKYLINKLEYE